MSDLTHVELLWLEKRIENWIRFGHAAEEQILDKRRRILSFAPGSIFAFVRWTSNDFGTIISRIDIFRAVAPGQRCATVPYVRPGGDILLRLSGWPKVERVLQIVDAVEALGIDPADAAPDYWHHVHNRLSVNEVPRDLHARRVIRPGCIGGGSRRDRPLGDTSDDAGGRDRSCCRRSRRDQRHAIYGTLPQACRSVSTGCARRQTCCHRSCRGPAARTSRNIPRRSATICRAAFPC